MRIGIDAREIKKPHTGTGLYVINLIKSISEQDLINQYILFVDKGHKLDFELPLNFEYYDLNWQHFNKFQDQIIIPISIYLSKIDIFHVIHHDVTPFLTNVPLIVTVLDIAWIDFPGGSNLLFQKYYYIVTKYSLKKAKKVITISESTKNRILFHFPNMSNKTQPILIACDPAFTLNSEIDDFNKISTEFRVNKPVVLYVGSFAARKNVTTLIEAMKIYWDKHNNCTQLILAGKPSGKDDDILNDFINKYPIVIISRPKTNSELRALYKNATVFVFPSLYEGFGLPVLEAMTCGCPVIASNSTSIPEIINNHNFLFEPKNTISLSGLIENILHNNLLQCELSKTGLEHSLKFTWKNVAAATLKIYLN